jgi:hypothetical protein
MIKNWKQFIKESVTNPDSYLDMRMQEIKDLLDNSENSEALIYEWENKNDHELYVNFSANGMNVRYEFDIDDMQVTKIANDVHDFTEEVESMEAGVEMIEKDIHSILGISERFLNEAIVDYKSDDVDGLMGEINTYPRHHRFQLSDLARLGAEYNIEIVDYDTFYRDLPQRDKTTAPSKTARESQFFALVNPVTKRPRVVLNLPMPFIPKDFFDQVPLGDILKHEQIHVGQHSRRPNIDMPLPEPKDKKAYFSNKDEVMAFAFSVAKEIVSMFPTITTPKEGFDKLIENPRIFRLYGDIKENTDEETLKRYHKYIYLYLEDLLKTEDEVKESSEYILSGDELGEYLIALAYLWIIRKRLTKERILNNIKEMTLDLVKFLNMMGYHIDVDVLRYRFEELINKAFAKKDK